MLDLKELIQDWFISNTWNTVQKMKFSIKDFVSKCDQIRRKLLIWSHYFLWSERIFHLSLTNIIGRYELHVNWGSLYFSVKVYLSDKTMPLLYFSVSLKFGACYITGQWGEFRVKNATLCFHLLFWDFPCCFSPYNLGLYHFHFFLWWSIKFPQHNINQSETGIGNLKLPVELYVNSPLQHLKLQTVSFSRFIVSMVFWITLSIGF